MRRVVVTGLGAYTPIGSNVSRTWRNILEGEQSLIALDDFHNREHFSRVSKLVPLSTKVSRINTEPLPTFSIYDQRRITPASQIVLEKTEEALEQAGLHQDILNTMDRTKIGCIIGTGMPPIRDLEEVVSSLFSKPKISPFLIPRLLPNMATGNVMIKHNLQGPSGCPSTACATGNSSIIEAYHAVKLGYSDIMICGSYEFSIDPISIAGFYRSKTISKKHQSRPFDAERDGFIMGEGCGVLILESLDSAISRKANILAEVKGVGLSNDGYHITSPLPNGAGGKLAMEMALRTGSLEPKDIGYINAHATSTPLGDLAEATAIDELFGNNKPYISSSKGHIGHLLGGAGSIEAILTILALNQQVFPHTLNLNDIDESIQAKGLNLIQHAPIQDKTVEYSLSNSFGFGGINTSVLFGKA